MAPVRDASGDLAYFFASQVDVTLEREKLEGLESHNAALMAEVADRLRAQQEVAQRLQFATVAGRLGIWDLDLATDELTASPVFRAGFDLPAEGTCIYRDLLSAIHPLDRDGVAEQMSRSVASKGDVDVECRTAHGRHGTRWVQMRAQVTGTEDGRPLRVAGVSLDVTERKAADVRRRAMVDLRACPIRV